MDVEPEPGKIYCNSEAKSSKVEEVGKNGSTPVRNEGVASVQVEVRRKKKKRRSKEKRQERLHKFHQKLVKTRGLPPNRLMEQRGTGLDDVKKDLDGEFDQVREQYLHQLCQSQTIAGLESRAVKNKFLRFTLAYQQQA